MVRVLLPCCTSAQLRMGCLIRSTTPRERGPRYCSMRTSFCLEEGIHCGMDLHKLNRKEPKVGLTRAVTFSHWLLNATSCPMSSSPRAPLLLVLQSTKYRKAQSINRLCLHDSFSRLMQQSIRIFEDEAVVLYGGGCAAYDGRLAAERRVV